MTPKLLLLVFAFAACTGSSDGTSISGTNGFSVVSSVMMTQGLHCSTSGVLPSGELEALTVILADGDLDPSLSDNLEFPHVLDLQVATRGYAVPTVEKQPIVAGTTFPILDEGKYDETLCGDVPGGSTQPVGIAMLELCPSGRPCSAYDYATSGTITVSSVSSMSVEGTFDLTLVNPDREPQGTLSGSFSATASP